MGNRGGRRPGAGAPRKHVGGRVAKNISLSEAHCRLISWWRERQGCDSDSAAVAEMIERAVFPKRTSEEIEGESVQVGPAFSANAPKAGERAN